MPIDVKWFSDKMRGAPVLNGNTPGGLIALLDACLITGFGATSALSVTVSGGIATATLQAGMTFLPQSVVLVSGATPAVLNGEARVLTSSNTAITFATTAPDGTATGSINIRYAPVGFWEKTYTGTNKAVYLSTHPQSNGMYVRIDDINGQFARVRAYETMTDVDTGTGPFPTDAQMNGGGYWHKSASANANAVVWKLFADPRIFYPDIAPSTSTGASNLSAAARGFGDPIRLRPAGDAYATLLSVNWSTVTTTNGSLDGGTASNTSGATVFPRPISGLGSSVLVDAIPATGGATAVSGGDGVFGAFPSEVDGELKLSPRFLKEQGATKPPRARLPGVYSSPQTGVYGSILDGDILDGAGPLAGRKLMAVATSAGSSFPSGAYFMDITGPWR